MEATRTKELKDLKTVIYAMEQQKERLVSEATQTDPPPDPPAEEEEAPRRSVHAVPTLDVLAAVNNFQREQQQRRARSPVSSYASSASLSESSEDENAAMESDSTQSPIYPTKGTLNSNYTPSPPPGQLACQGRAADPNKDTHTHTYKHTHTHTHRGGPAMACRLWFCQFDLPAREAACYASFSSLQAATGVSYPSLDVVCSLRCFRIYLCSYLFSSTLWLAGWRPFGQQGKCECFLMSPLPIIGSAPRAPQSPQGCMGKVCGER